jgi:excisionase family DNA binding protein
VAEVARALHCSRATIFELLKKKALKRAPRVGRPVLITRASVELVLAGRRRAGRAPQVKAWKPWERSDLSV